MAFEFGVDANIVALSASAGANFSTLGNEAASARVAGTDHSYEYRLNDALQYNKGLAVFTVTLGGLMFETCLSGQEYEYKPFNKNGSFRNESRKSFASASSSKKEEEEEEREKDVFAKAQREVSAQIENIQKFAKSISKKWKKDDTAAAGDGAEKTPIDAAVDYKTTGEAASTTLFYDTKEDEEAATTETETVQSAPVVAPPGESVKVF